MSSKNVLTKYLGKNNTKTYLLMWKEPANDIATQTSKHRPLSPQICLFLNTHFKLLNLLYSIYKKSWILFIAKFLQKHNDLILNTTIYTYINK